MVTWFALAGCLLLAEPQPVDLIANGGFTRGLEGWAINQDQTCTARVVAGEAGPNKHILRLELKPPAGADAWSIQLLQGLDTALGQGDPLVVKAWLRSPDRCRVFVFIQQDKAPWGKSLGELVELTPEWREVELRGTARAAYPAQGSAFGMHLAYGPGTVEIAGVRAYDLKLTEDVVGPRASAEHPLSLIRNGDFAAGPEEGWFHHGAGLTAERVNVTVGGLGQGVRLTCRPPPGQPAWSLGFGQATAAPVRRGDAIYVRAWLRSPERCRVTFVFELNAPPNSKSLSMPAKLTPEWQEYRFVGRSLAAYQPGEATFKWFLGHDAGTVEIAGVRVEDYGEAAGMAFEQTIDWFGGRDNPDTWRAVALERIERLRKGDLAVSVVDAAGQPVPGAAVRVEQQRHAFRFGSAVPAGRLLDTQNPDNLRFQQEVERLYNTVTFENDLKWTGERPGQLELVDRAAQWLAERGIELRGHNLVWGSFQFLGPAARNLRGPALLQAMRDHVAAYGGHMRGKLYLWDVVNEAGSNTEVWDSVGWEQFAESFRWARAADPEAQLCYNDYGILADPSPYRGKVAARIRQLLEAGAPVDVLGIQGHLGVPLTPLVRVLELLDEWAEFGKPLEITEFDLGCEDDVVHGAYVRDVLTAAFSHPAMQAFIMWGFWEGSHWRAKDHGAMFRRDWSKRPAEEAWEDLVLKQWWTRWEGRTDAAGGAALRAFHGRHRVTAVAGGRRAEGVVELAPGAAGRVVVRLPE